MERIAFDATHKTRGQDSGLPQEEKEEAASGWSGPCPPPQGVAQGVASQEETKPNACACAHVGAPDTPPPRIPACQLPMGASEYEDGSMGSAII